MEICRLALVQDNGSYWANERIDLAPEKRLPRLIV
jgi:hypothetical protein